MGEKCEFSPIFKRLLFAHLSKYPQIAQIPAGLDSWTGLMVLLASGEFSSFHVFIDSNWPISSFIAFSQWGHSPKAFALARELGARAAHEYGIYLQVTRTRRYNVWMGICIHRYGSMGIFYNRYGYVKLENLHICGGTCSYTYLLNGTSQHPNARKTWVFTCILAIFVCSPLKIPADSPNSCRFIKYLWGQVLPAGIPVLAGFLYLWVQSAGIFLNGYG